MRTSRLVEISKKVRTYLDLSGFLQIDNTQKDDSRDLSKTQEEIRRVYIGKETEVIRRGMVGRDKISMSQNV
jgi:hypothetical protein